MAAPAETVRASCYFTYPSLHGAIRETFADRAEAVQNKPTAESGAESPTTARPLEMDDDDVQETGVAGEDGTTVASTTTPAAGPTPPPTSTEAPPPKPPRPLTEAQKNVMILKEAFPGVEDPVIKAVLRASGGQVEPAFNALLGKCSKSIAETTGSQPDLLAEMTDPDAIKNEAEDVPPPQPRRPQGQPEMTQVEADELYARQLAEHYDNVGAYEARTSNRSRGAQRQQGLDDDDDDRDYSFIDDDLPVIRENLRKGFLDTQTKVNGWITSLRKKIEENFDESEESTQRQGQPFRRPGEPSRRSGDYDRYDADPQVLSDDFAGMRFSADGSESNRTKAEKRGADTSIAPAKRPVNPGLHKPPPPSSSPRPSDGRRVGFKDEPQEINMYDASPKVPPKDTPSSGTRASKWQPLSAVEPGPVTDNDPFSLGDSEDEKEVKDKDKDKDKDKPKDSKTESKTDDSERLKKAAAEAMADSLVDPAKGESNEKKS
ncbi:CUE domain-containing protein 5 [Tolypocladium capitatum]|uniref:CUE domain-containing protein 5 n=1 Tax=Tolypocladium capitatum TaxID=45235 RepID=A0A2K3QKC1_9HYPO|nr:CUE domain-containing protein 5 [Tolypocladium capitatum]